jgi:penicillin-binding protein 1A
MQPDARMPFHDQTGSPAEFDRLYRTPVIAPSLVGAARAFGERWSVFWARPGVQKALRITSGVVVVFGIVWIILFAGIPKLPHPDELWTLNRAPAVQFVDANGTTVAVRGHLYGPPVRGAELPAYLGQAFIAAEDQRFLKHNGVDLQSISRAFLANLSAGRTVQGGSTLTQQLVKNLLVGNDQSLRRKAQEARLAIEMESALTKQEILDLYLNRVYLGANAYGVEAAAQAYFGKPASALSLAEAAFLGALPKAPSRYAENKTGPETTARIHYVLDRMAASGFVTREEVAAAKSQKLSFVEASSQKPISGYVLDVAMEEARAVVPDLPPDAVIAITVDGALQRRAEAALNAALSVRRLGATEGAIVVMDRHGPIRALVGGRDYKKSQFNRATQALRQPGSAFKTFVFAAALEQGLNPTTVRNDAPVKLAAWEPGNYEGVYRGPITLARALAVSSNSVAAQIGSEIGPKKIVNLAQRFGIESHLQPYPSIALGADEVTLLEMTRAYGVLANEGKRVQPHIISEIRDQRGAVLYRAQAANEEQVYEPRAAEVMTGMLANVVRSGTGVQAQIPGWQIAGKTGTSQSWRDAWFIGYSARLVGGIWIGNDDERAMRKVTGGGAAAALFAKVMTTAHRSLKPELLRGADLGAAWLGADIDEIPLDEWFDFPELDLATDLPEYVSLSDELSETPVDPLTPPLQTVASPTSEPVLLPSGPPIDGARLPPAAEADDKPGTPEPLVQDPQEPEPAQEPAPPNPAATIGDPTRS